MTVPDKKETDKESKELKEKNFIHEEKLGSALSLLLWMIIFLGVIILLWQGGVWVAQQVQTKVEASPFLQVTNREMSLFLWQNSEHMRVHAKNKTGYLPGFYSMRKVKPKLETVDAFVVAPPDSIFLYHTWKRLLSQYVISRPILSSEFKAFLSYSEEWNPKYWTAAPEEYRHFIEKLDTLSIENLQILPEDTLPTEVRIAFMGWKNYFQEGDLINQVVPTVAEMQEFIHRYPNYSRNYWRNIYPNYLQSLLQENIEPESRISNQELAPFLRVAFYNYQQAKKCN